MATRPHLAILGAGPIGIEVALAAADAGLPFTLYEAGVAPAANVAEWGHVRLFTPWRLSVSPRQREHLERAGHVLPDPEACPRGDELRERILVPLAATPAIAPRLRLGARVRGIGRAGLLKHEEIATAARGALPFRLLIDDARQGERIEVADVVIDCTGTWGHPNALGDGGIPAVGEGRLGQRIARRIPDLTREASEWSGHTVLLVGSGHSAQTAARDLDELARGAPGTRILWALRRERPLFGTRGDDPLPERGRLATAAAQLAAGSSPHVWAYRGVAVDRLEEGSDGKLHVTLRRRTGESQEVIVDRVLSLTGAVGDPQLYRQLQVHECYATSGPMKLAAAILGSGGGDCLAQRTHGVDTLKSPEPGFFLVGAKSYGRSSSFLLRVGWEQAAEVMEDLVEAPRSAPLAL